MPIGVYKDRAAWTHFGSDGYLNEVRAAARAKDLELSAYVRAACEAFEKPREVSSYDANQLRAQVRRLEADLAGKDLLLSKQADELHRLRESEFLKESWDADISSELISILQSGPAREHQIFENLGAKDVSAMQAVAQQLYVLERVGLAKKTSHGWQWKR